MRDLLRKRLQLVRYRISHILSAQNQLWRTTGTNVPAKSIKQFDYTLLNFLDDPHVRMAVKSNLDVIRVLSQKIDSLEKAVNKEMDLSPQFKSLLTINGVGPILGQTIALETGDINRFKAVGNFASYARCVDSTRLSNGKKKGSNNSKNGNKYLSWAFVEAAHSIIRHNKTAHRFYQRKRAQKNAAVATKALAHKLARAAYYVMRDQKPFELSLLFP